MLLSMRKQSEFTKKLKTSLELPGAKPRFELADFNIIHDLKA